MTATFCLGSGAFVRRARAALMILAAAAAAYWPDPASGQDEARLALAQIVPANRVILIYKEPDGRLIPAHVLNAAGDVAVAEDIARSSIIWVTIDSSGRARPLEISPAGEVSPARATGDGRPLLPADAPPETDVFAAQIGNDGQLQVLLLRVDRTFEKVVLRDDKTLVRADAGEAAPAKPLKFSGFLMVDNSGNGATGIHRGNASVRVENLWNRDHTAALFAASSLRDPNALGFVDASYSLPFAGLVENADDRLAFSASYNRVNYETLPPGQPAVSKFLIRGYSLTTTYVQNLAQSESESGTAMSHSLIYGMTYDKSWTQDYGFGQDAMTSIVRIPLSLRYDFKVYNDALGLLTVAPTYVRNLPVEAAGDGNDYRNDRNGADPRYDKFILDVSHDYDFLSGWSSSTHALGQAADQPLIQAEAISLGGLGSVRGLEFAKSVGELGLIGQLELKAPDLLTQPYSARPSVFVDAGWINKHGEEPDTVSSETAVGTGVGLTLAGPGGLFAQVYAAWLVGGTAESRYVEDDGRFQFYFNAGVNF